MRRSLGALTLACSLVAAGWAQEPAPAAAQGLVPWAPRWRVGAWWVVTTWQKDSRERTRSPAPAPGAEPARPPLDPEPIPGFPPLRDGVPVGYKPGNRFRFEVLRREAVRYPDDEPGTPPEEFWVVRVRTLEGEPARVADLHYAVADLTLARVVLDPEGSPRAHALRGTALLGVPASLELGCPLDWPDLRAAAQERAELVIPGRPKLEQRVRRAGEGQAEAYQVRLAALDERGQTEGARASFLWRPGEPFWSRLASGELLGRLDEFGPR